MTTIVDGQAGITFNDASVQGTAGYTGFRNRIINGDMRIDQRFAGASQTPTTNTYSVDRWQFNVSQASKFSCQQNQGSITPPSGFSNYVGATVVSAYTPSASDTFFTGQWIEGYNISDLAQGTGTAKTYTVSFYVYTNQAGVHSGSIRGYNGSAFRGYPFTFTVNAANTWQFVSVVIPGDTVTFAYGTGNSYGLQVCFNLGTGSTYLGTAGSWSGNNYVGAVGSISLVSIAGATFYFTGVQLEVGGVATAFERRNFGIELAMCQRYYQSSYPQGTAAGSADGNGINFVATGTNRLVGASSLAVVMRAAPNAVIYDPGAANTTNQVRNQSNGAVAVTGTAFNSNTTYAFTRVITFSGTPFTAGQDYNFHYTAAAEI
jgi:hypothetical protein